MTEDPKPTPGTRPSVARSGPRNGGAAALAAAALASGKSMQEAAQAAGVGRRTLTRWMSNPEFSTRVDALRTEAITTAMNRLGAAMGSAADALGELLTHSDPHVKFKAAKAVIETGMKLKEHGELVQRIHELEQKLANPQPVYRGPPPNQTREDVM